VIAALEVSYVEEAFHGIAPVAILELFQRILDRRIGREEG
jgi:hypothetical protein